MADTSQYWVTLEPEMLGGAVKERFEKWLEELEKRGRMSKIREATQRYYNDGDTVEFGGKRGELTLVRINHFRSLVTTTLSMTTSQRPAYEATASDDTSDAAAQVQLSQQVLDYELDRGVELEAIDAAWRMLVQAEGAIAVLWDPAAGDTVMMEPGAEGGQPMPVQAGELIVESYSAYDVARDSGAKGMRKLPWVILRRRMSRWDLLAQYPEAEAEIRGARNCFDSDRSDARSVQTTTTVESEQIYVLELYADRSPAVPQGRYARVVEGRYLEGGPMPYRDMPVVIRSADEVRDRALGSTQMWDLLSLCELIDASDSAMATVQDAFGRNNILTAKGHGLAVSDLGGGMQKVEYNPVVGEPPPGPMEVPRITDADLKHNEHLVETAQVLCGINSLTRGNPDSNVKAGVSMAMLQAMAVQHLSRFQAAYADLLREMGTRIVRTYQTFAKAPRIIELTGSSELRTAQQFTGTDISKIHSIRVELGSAMTRTTAGKMELADALADLTKFPPTPEQPPITREQYVGVRTTGRLEPITRAPRSAMLGLRAECEALSRGEPAQVLPTDDPIAHIREHKALLDGQQRMGLSPEVIMGITQHIDQHLMQWEQMSATNQAMLMALGYPPAPMPAPMMPPGGPAGGPGGPPAGPDGGPPPTEPVPIGEPPIPGTPPQQAQLPDLPQTPMGTPPPMPTA
jgi:hypothetical protein